MNKISYPLLGLILICYSCDTDCNGCGPTGYTKYLITNKLTEDINVLWFGNTTGPLNNLMHEFHIVTGETLLLYESSQLGESGILSTKPFNSINPYDSVRFETLEWATIYIDGDCLIGNPLCEENYTLLKFVDTKDQKIKEWEFEIE